MNDAVVLLIMADIFMCGVILGYHISAWQPKKKEKDDDA